MAITKDQVIEKIQLLSEHLFNLVYFIHSDMSEESILQIFNQEVGIFFEDFPEVGIFLTSLSSSKYDSMQLEIFYYFLRSFTSLNYDHEDKRIKAFHIVIEYLEIQRLRNMVI